MTSDPFYAVDTDGHSFVRRLGVPRCEVGKRRKLFTTAEVAEHLNVSTRTVRRWIKAGALPVHRIGGLVRISEADFAAFLALRREA